MLKKILQVKYQQCYHEQKTEWKRKYTSKEKYRKWINTNFKDMHLSMDFMWVRSSYTRQYETEAMMWLDERINKSTKSLIAVQKAKLYLRANSSS